MKPYQEQVRMIREGFEAALADADQGPLLRAALADAFSTEGVGLSTEDRALLDDLAENALREDDQLPPYNPMTLSAAATNLDNSHHLGALLLTAAGALGTARTMTIRTQANYAWADKVIFSAGTKSGAFRLIAATGVSFNGSASVTLECPGGASAISCWRHASNDWLVRGDFTVV
jgi:hypothetical protein